MMKKLLILSLSLVLSASIIAGPLDTFYIKLNKITKDLKDTTISPDEAAKQIHAAREELYKMGGLAFKKSPQLKERIDQIKKDNPVFAKELEKIEAAIKKEKEERRARTRKPAPAPTPTTLLSVTDAKKAFDNAYKEVEKILPRTSTWNRLTDYIKAEIIKKNIKEIDDVLKNFKQAIEVYQKTVGGPNDETLEMKKNYNFYPLEINRQILKATQFAINRNEVNKEKTLTLIDYNIDTLFTYTDGQVIEGNRSQVNINTDKTDAFDHYIKKTKDDLKADARAALKITAATATHTTKPFDFGEALESLEIM